MKPTKDRLLEVVTSCRAGERRRDVHPRGVRAVLPAAPQASEGAEVLRGAARPRVTGHRRRRPLEPENEAHRADGRALGLRRTGRARTHQQPLDPLSEPRRGPHGAHGREPPRLHGVPGNLRSAGPTGKRSRSRSTTSPPRTSRSGCGAATMPGRSIRRSPTRSTSGSRKIAASAPSGSP